MLSEKGTVPCSKLVTVLSTVSHATLSVQVNSLVVFIFRACGQTLHKEKSAQEDCACQIMCGVCVCLFSSHHKLTIHPIDTNVVKIAMS